MADVFLSYSRRDSEFVRRLADALDRHGKQVWVDTEGIRDGEVFPAALQAAVEGSDGFVFVISPDAVGSKYCRQEVDHALELGKRIVPLVHRRVPDEEVPEPIRERNWIPFEGDGEFDQGIERLVAALDTDLEHAKAHTRWLVKALEWDAEGRDRSFLLRGAELGAAERWLGEAAGKDPEPTSLQHEYVYASRGAATRRLRMLSGAMALALAVAVALAVVALTQRNAARHQSAIAGSRELAAISENQLLIDPELATLLGIEAVKRQPTPQATLALREALDASALRKTLLGHQDIVGAVAFSPDGRLLASASPGIDDMSVRIWDVRSGRQLRAIYPNGHPRRIDQVPPSGAPPSGTPPSGAPKGAPNGAPQGPPPNGPPNGRAPVFVPKGQLPPGAVQGRRFPNTVVFSPDGKQLVVGLDSGGVSFYDVASGRLLLNIGGSNSHVSRIHFSADGRLALVSGVGLPAVATVHPPRPFLRLPLPSRNQQVYDSDISADGRLAAIANPDGYTVWDVRTGRMLHRTPGDTGAAVAFSPTKPVLAFGGHAGRIALMDPRTGHVMRTIANLFPAGPNRLTWSPDGTRLAAALTDGTARIWDVASGRELERFAGHRCCVLSVVFSPDGRLLATGAEDHKVNLWSSNGNVIDTVRASQSQITGLAFTAGGELAITAKGSDPQIWKPGAAPRSLPNAGHGQAVVVSDDGRLLALAGPGRSATLVDAATGTVERTLGAPAQVQAVAFDHSARRVAVASKHGARVFSTRDGSALTPQSAPLPTSLIGIVPGRNELVEALTNVGGQDSGTIWFTSLPGGRVARHITSAGPFLAMSLNPSGSQLAAVARADPGVRIFDVGTAKEVRELLGHISEVTSLAWSADGKMLATAGVDGTVRVWNPATGDELRLIRHGAPVDAVAFSRDGSRLAFGDIDGNVELWAGCPGCASTKALLALAQRSVTRKLTALERRTFLVH